MKVLATVARTSDSRESARAALHPGVRLHRGTELSPSHLPASAGNLATLRALGIRAKPEVSQPSDPEEVEADRLAAAFSDQKAASHSNSAMQGGENVPLAPAVRRDYERFFHTELSDVRVHTGAAAQQAARGLNAQAFTVGTDIYFGRDHFDVRGSTGRALLAHELAHVAQQEGNTASARGDASTIRRRLLVDDPAGAPVAAPPGETNETIVRDYLAILCPDFMVVSGVVEPVAGFCLVGSASATPESCDCLCEMHSLATDWTIKVDDDDWPHTDPGTQTVTVHSPFSGLEFGQWSVGPPAHRAAIPNWLVLGHELCGHGLLIARGTHPTGPPPTHGGRPSHDVTVDAQNRIAAEHGVPADELRGLFADPHHGESFAKVTIAEFPFGSADVSALPPPQSHQIDIAEAFILGSTVDLDVIGHADSPASSAASNLAISQQRAENVQSELEGRGIDPGRFLVVKGVGDSECALSGRQPSCRKAEVFMFNFEGASIGHP